VFTFGSRFRFAVPVRGSGSPFRFDSATAVAPVLATVPAIFTNIPAVLAPVASILDAIPPAALVPRIADVFADIAPIFTAVASVFAAIDTVLDAIPPLLPGRLRHRDRDGQKRDHERGDHNLRQSHHGVLRSKRYR
jgi:hypothetical protein